MTVEGLASPPTDSSQASVALYMPIVVTAALVQQLRYDDPVYARCRGNSPSVASGWVRCFPGIGSLHAEGRARSSLRILPSFR